MPSAFPGGSTLTEAATHHPQNTAMPSTALAAPAAAGELAAAAATGGSPATKPAVVEASNVTVAVRVRPLTEQEKLRMKDLKQPYMVVDSGRQITVRDAADEPKPFAFDHCFDSREAQDATASQEEVFEAIGKKVLTHAWEGFNASVFAYGQTGSGKTYTMMGGDGPEEAGLVPRICQQLFQAIEEAKAQNHRKNVSTRMSYGGYRSGDGEEEDEDDSSSSSSSSAGSRRSSSGAFSAFSDSDVVAAAGATGGQDMVEFGLKVQYLEIYNERILDLLSKDPDKQLKERQLKGSAFVEGGTVCEVSDWAGMQAVLKLGEENRKVAATRANVQSSRSHAVFFLEFTQVSSKRSLLPKSKGTGGHAGGDVAVARKSTICLVDLAGSERISKTGATGAQLKEAQSINLSLMTLGRVISVLAKGGQPAHIPYRESKLTQLCRDFIGGNAKTFVLATVSPSVSERGETLGTLGYANQAKNIVTKAQVNEDPKDAYIRHLEGELARANAKAALLDAHNSKAGHGPYAFPGDEAGAPVPSSHSHAHHSSISGAHAGKGNPVLKMDGKEAGNDPAAAGNGPAAAAGGPLSPAGSAADYSVVTAGSSTDESAAPHHHDPVVTSNSSVASAISSSASSAMGHRRMHSKSSDAGSSCGSGSGTTASPGHSRTPSQVSRLPRLANTTTLAAGAVAASALNTPLSPAFLPSPQLAAAGAKDATPTAAAAATANTATPTTPSEPVVSHNLAAALGQEAAAASSASSSSPSKAAFAAATERMTVEEALVLKQRFLKAEQEVAAQARGELGQQQLANQLTARVLAALPLVLEANALAQASNKPVAFYLDVVPRALPPREKAARATETLQHLGQASLADAMGLPSRNSLATAGAAGAATPSAPLLPALLEAAEEAPAVVVRAVGALSDGVAELSVEAFKEALQAMKAARTRPGGPMPLIQGYESTADTGLAGLAAGAGADGKADPFHFPGQDSTLARSDVYLSALLGNRNVLGTFPLLRGLDGACVGTVKLKLVPQAELPASPVGVAGGYSLALELEELVVDKAPLGQLAVGGAWNAAQDSYQPAALRYPDEGVPGLVLRYGFWPCDAPCGEVALSAGASAVREMAARGRGTGGVGEEQVRFPMSHKAALTVPSVGPEFLAYLATGALRLTLHLSKDPAEDALWTRHHGISQLPTERCWALARVQSVDAQPEATVAPAAVPSGGASVYSHHHMHEEEDDEVRAALGGARTHRRRPAMRGLIPEDQEVDGYHDDGDLFSVMGSVAPPGAFDTCSRMSLRMAGSRVGSVRRSAVTRHAAHFYGRQHPDTACFLFMAVDVLEPVLEPGVDYFNEHPTKFLPVDIKPVATGRGPFKMLGGKGGRQLGAVPDPRFVHRSAQDEDDEMGLGLDDEWDLHSDMDSVASGFPACSSAASVASGRYGGLPPHLAHLGQVDWAAGSNAVFHVMANPLIRMRRLRVVLEQVGPLAGPMLLESCLRVRASSYVNLSKREYTGDISDHTMVATDLEVVKVARSTCKRRLEVTLNLPTSQCLCEKSVRGDRVVLALEVAAFLDGAAQPVVLQRNVVMKVLPPERKQAMLYRMRKSLREPLSDRLHRVGSYYAVKAAKGPHLHETVADFVHFKLAAREQLLRRMARARSLQEGGDARPDLPDCAAWRAALTANTAGAEEAAGKPLEVDVDAAPEEAGGIGAALAGTMLLNVAERKAVAAALFGVELRAPGSAAGGGPGKHGNGGYGRLVAPGGQVKRGADGVYRVEAIPSSEQGAASGGGGLMAARVVTYEYPARGTGQQACRERERCWDALSRLWTVEVPDFPTTREGFLNIRTGLLGVQSTRMWFVWRRPFLFVYKAQVGGAHGQATPVDVVNVTDCRVALGEDDLDFEIQGARKTWSLQASCEEDLTSWILALGQPVPGVTDGCGNLLLTGTGMGMGMGGGASVVSGGGVPLLCYGGPASDASVSGSMSVRSYRSYATQAPSRTSYRY